MSPQDVKKYYRTGYNFRKETGMSCSTFSNWIKWGFVPIVSQIKLFQLTNGELKLDIGNER